MGGGPPALVGCGGLGRKERSMDDVAVVYESKTGTTRRLALAVGDELFGRGIRCTTYPTAGVTAAAIADTNVFILGTWTDGLFAVGQRPGGRRHLERVLADLGGPDGQGLADKRCLVYCTYAVTPGRTLEKLAAMVTDAGGTVSGGLAVRRDRLEQGAQALVSAVTETAGV
jgi:hypothetical protein